jgi:hypothetical protein
MREREAAKERRNVGPRRWNQGITAMAELVLVHTTN